MSKYDRKMEFFGSKETGECCFTFGTLKLDDKFVLIDRDHISVLEECAKVLLRTKDAITTLDGTSIENEQLVDDFHAVVAKLEKLK